MTTPGTGPSKVTSPKAGAEHQSSNEANILQSVCDTARTLGMHAQGGGPVLANGACPDVVLTANGRKLWVTVSVQRLKAWEVSAAKSLGGTVAEHDRAFAGNLVIAPSDTSAHPNEGVVLGQTWFVSLPLRQEDDLMRLRTTLLHALLAGSP